MITAELVLFLFLNPFWLVPSLVFLFVLVSSTFAVVGTRGRLGEFLRSQRDTPEIKEMDRQAHTQKRLLLPRVTGLKAFGAIFPFLSLIWVAHGVRRFYDAYALAGSLDPALFAVGMGEFILMIQIGLVLSLLAWVFYFVFSWIFQRRILTLEGLKYELAH